MTKRCIRTRRSACRFQQHHVHGDILPPRRCQTVQPANRPDSTWDIQDAAPASGPRVTVSYGPHSTLAPPMPARLPVLEVIQEAEASTEQPRRTRTPQPSRKSSPVVAPEQHPHRQHRRPHNHRRAHGRLPRRPFRYPAALVVAWRLAARRHIGLDCGLFHSRRRHLEDLEPGGHGCVCRVHSRAFGIYVQYLLKHIRMRS